MNDIEHYPKPYKVGDTVLYHGQRCTVVEIDEGTYGGQRLTFASGGSTVRTDPGLDPEFGR